MNELLNKTKFLYIVAENIFQEVREKIGVKIVRREVLLSKIL